MVASGVSFRQLHIGKGSDICGVTPWAKVLLSMTGLMRGRAGAPRHNPTLKESDLADVFFVLSFVTGEKMKIYVASSWRNQLQPQIVSLFRSVGHEVYDFRHPAPGNEGFSWREIHPLWEQWTPDLYRDALEHPIAKAGFDLDMNALRACDACVLLLPSGRSASFEFGWAIGAGKQGAVVMLESCEPELMYLGNPILISLSEVEEWARKRIFPFPR